MGQINPSCKYGGTFHKMNLMHFIIISLMSLKINKYPYLTKSLAFVARKSLF